MILTRQQKADLVTRLASQGKPTRHIAELVHISLKDIGTITRRHTGEEEKAAEYQDKNLSISLVDVAIILNIKAYDV